MRRKPASIASLLVPLALLLLPLSGAAQPRAPEAFFGFALGTDGELARYPKIVEYLPHLAATPDRVRVEELGSDFWEHAPSRHELRGRRTGRAFRLGDRIRVRVVRVDPVRRRVDLALDRGAVRIAPRKRGGRRKGRR